LGFTVKSTFPEEVHPFCVTVYVKVLLPIPAEAGLKVPPETPVPDQIPPVGLPWLIVTGLAEVQKLRPAPGSTLGASTMVTVFWLLPPQVPVTV
jgi:hypothetical protein